MDRSGLIFILNRLKKFSTDLYLNVKHTAVVFLAFTRKKQFGPKVFCIGFNKTGTTSLGRALGSLGYRNSSFNRVVWRQYYLKGKIEKVIEYASKFESFDDLPWLKEDLIPFLDKSFPGSKWIYLERDEKEWKSSFVKWSKNRFGYSYDPDDGRRKYDAHRKFVFKYFETRVNKDLLVLSIKDPEGFKKLAEFLGKQTDQFEFPHFNKS